MTPCTAAASSPRLRRFRPHSSLPHAVHAILANAHSLASDARHSGLRSTGSGSQPFVDDRQMYESQLQNVLRDSLPSRENAFLDGISFGSFQQINRCCDVVLLFFEIFFFFLPQTDGRCFLIVLSVLDGTRSSSFLLKRILCRLRETVRSRSNDNQFRRLDILRETLCLLRFSFRRLWD